MRLWRTKLSIERGETLSSFASSFLVTSLRCSAPESVALGVVWGDVVFIPYVEMFDYVRNFRFVRIYRGVGLLPARRGAQLAIVSFAIQVSTHRGTGIAQVCLSLD